MRNFHRVSAHTNEGLKLTLALVAATLVGGCSQTDDLLCSAGSCSWSEAETSALTSLADLPAAPPPDPSNKVVGNPAAEQLGRKFFWDTRFSGVSNGTDALKRPMPWGRAAKGQPLNISCATCHDLKRGGIDPASVPGNVSLGAGWTDTNTSTVFNDAFFPLILWSGRADSLWEQAAGSIEASMGSSRLRAAWTIATLYRAEYEAVFPQWPLPMTGTSDPRFPPEGKPGSKAGCQAGDASEPFGDAYDCMDPADQIAVTRVVVNFGKAVAAFEYRLVSRNSAFDTFANDLRQGNADSSPAISPEAKNGARLFVGKAGCSDCHNGPLLSDKGFHNVGVASVGMGVPTVNDCPAGAVCDCVNGVNCLPFGVRDGVAKMQKNPYRRDRMFSDDPTDTSRKSYYDMSLDTLPRGGWRTPSLRDVALTAPYMHTGSLPTLEDVVAHYNRGGDPQAIGDVAVQLQPLYLTDREQSQLVAFLKTLTGEPLAKELSDPPVLP
jgi:cytochrome c peroxidase